MTASSTRGTAATTSATARFDDDERALRAALAAGPTAGPWHLDECDEGAFGVYVGDVLDATVVTRRGQWPHNAAESRANGRHISAASPDRIARVLDAAADLRKQRDELLQMLKALAKHDTYETEYAGQMLTICPSCHQQGGEHTDDCEFVQAHALIARVEAQQ